MLSGYDSEENSNEFAPDVVINSSHTLSRASNALSRPVVSGTEMITHNFTANAIGGFVAGPANPYSSKAYSLTSDALDEATFDENFHQRTKKRKMPKSTIIIGQDGVGPWADTNSVSEEEETISAEQQEYLNQIELNRADATAKIALEQEIKSSSRSLFGEDLKKIAKTFFHAPEEHDYQGRPWTYPPSLLKPSDGWHDCFIPNRCSHIWQGHSKGVQAIEIFPELGHLLLSGSLDTTCKIWGMYESCTGGRDEKRSYCGHNEPIKDVSFNNDGSRFLSSSYDNTMLVWDVETGDAIVSLSNNAVANCGRFYPVDNNIILAAYSNNRVVEWDLRTGEIIQEYSHHLMPVNTICFYDNAKRFCTTSDDKKMLCWEMGTPVPTAYIQDVLMQSMPVTRRHPKDTYIACQSMDNKMITFDIANDRLKRGKRVFQGHNSAGFACAIDFSPNGKFVLSGDSSGKLYFWDANSGKKFRELKVHEKLPCIGARWHPVEPSWVVTCAWDGLIKLWQ